MYALRDLQSYFSHIGEIAITLKFLVRNRRLNNTFNFAEPKVGALHMDHCIRCASADGAVGDNA